MANNFLDEKGRDKIFSKVADDFNETVQEYLKKTGKDSVKFSIGAINFDIKAKEIER